MLAEIIKRMDFRTYVNAIEDAIAKSPRSPQNESIIIDRSPIDAELIRQGYALRSAMGFGGEDNISSLMCQSLVAALWVSAIANAKATDPKRLEKGDMLMFATEMTEDFAAIIDKGREMAELLNESGRPRMRK